MILGNRSCVTLPPGRRTAASMQSYSGGGKSVHFSDLLRLTGTLLASKDRKNDLDFPLASLRTPKSDRLLAYCKSKKTPRRRRGFSLTKNSSYWYSKLLVSSTERSSSSTLTVQAPVQSGISVLLVHTRQRSPLTSNVFSNMTLPPNIH